MLFLVLLEGATLWYCLHSMHIYTSCINICLSCWLFENILTFLLFLWIWKMMRKSRPQRQQQPEPQPQPRITKVTNKKYIKQPTTTLLNVCPNSLYSLEVWHSPPNKITILKGKARLPTILFWGAMLNFGGVVFCFFLRLKQWWKAILQPSKLRRSRVEMGCFKRSKLEVFTCYFNGWLPTFLDATELLNF